MARSKGCMTCLKRKVKCDEIRPTCKRCEKSKLECAGYGKAFQTFVDERPRIERIQALDFARQNELKVLRESSHILYHTSQFRNRWPEKFSNPPVELSLKGFSSDIFTSFLIDRLFDNLLRYDANAWWAKSCLSSAASYTERIALNALATVFYGAAHGLQELKVNAARLYAKALSTLRTDLVDPNHAFSFGTIAATTALSMYELISFTTRKGWIAHAGGMGALLQARGPWRHKNHPEKGVYHHSRIILVADAILSRKRTFLENRIWKDVPWEDDPSSKDSCAFLIDILASIPGILEDMDALSRDGGLSTDQRLQEELQTKIYGYLEDLNHWWRGWYQARLNTCTEYPCGANSSISDEQGLLYASLLKYDEFWDAQITCVYNTGRILLSQQLQKLPDTNGAEHAILDEANPSPLLGVTSDVQGLAHEIIRSIEYCSYNSCEFTGTFCLLFPLSVAYTCFAEDSREARWIRENPNPSLTNVSGFAIGRHVLRSLQTQESL